MSGRIDKGRLGTGPEMTAKVTGRPEEAVAVRPMTAMRTVCVGGLKRSDCAPFVMTSVPVPRP